MAVVEHSGVPAVGIFGEAFRPMAALLAKQSGLSQDRLAIYPGMMATDPEAVLRERSRTALYPQVVQGLTTGGGAESAAEPSSNVQVSLVDLRPVFRGTFDEVQDHFYDHGWSDGLPIRPPTRAAVHAFLDRGGRSPSEVLAVLAPEEREATVLNVAVNGVMAGCRPEYMPVLLAVVECLGDPAFRIEDAGSTPGWEPLVVLGGPLVAALDFNRGTGAMRVGRRANSSIGRFARLYMRNVAGLRTPPGVTDQAGFGANFNVALAEDGEAVQQLGWVPHQVECGFAADDTVVTLQSVLTVTAPIYTWGDDPSLHLRWMSHYLERVWNARSVFKWNGGHQFLALSPSIASVFAAHGMSKDDVRRHLVDTTYASPADLDAPGQGTPVDWRQTISRRDQSDWRVPAMDAVKGVRIYLSDDWLSVIVSGNPGRNQSRAYTTNHVQGSPVSRRVVVP